MKRFCKYIETVFTTSGACCHRGSTAGMLQLAHFTRTIHSGNDDATQKRSELKDHIARLNTELEKIREELRGANGMAPPPPTVAVASPPGGAQKKGAPKAKKGKANGRERVPYGRHPLEQTAKGRRKLHTLLAKRRELEDRLRYARLNFASLDPAAAAPPPPPQTPKPRSTATVAGAAASKKPDDDGDVHAEDGDALNFAPPSFTVKSAADFQNESSAAAASGGGGGGGAVRGKLFAKEKTSADAHNSIETCDPAICPDCDAEMIISHRESVYICMLCYGIRKYTCMNNIGQQSEEANARAHSEYHRVGHFANYMQMFQAKESKDVPKAVMDIVRDSIKKMAQPEDGIFHIQTIRDILKQKRLSTFYANATQIWCKINKKAPPTLTPQQEAELYSMFNEIQTAYEKHNTERTNFVFYPYVFRKFCELQGYTHITDFLTHLKSRKRLGSNELLWKKICKDLNWEFIPTSWAATHM